MFLAIENDMELGMYATVSSDWDQASQVVMTDAHK
jgi:hypothetical protein